MPEVRGNRRLHLGELFSVMRRCNLDLDGVMTDFHGAAYKLHGIEDPFLKEENLGDYGLTSTTGIPMEDFFAPMGFDFWANLPRSKEFDVILQLVETFFGRENITIVTAPPEVRNPGCLEGKEEWIYRNLPNYKNKFLIGKPKDACANPDSVLIDDSAANTKAFRKAGGKTILVPRAWNPLYSYRAFPALHIRDCLLNLK